MKIKLNPDQEIVNTIREVTGEEERIEMEIRKRGVCSLSTGENFQRHEKGV